MGVLKRIFTWWEGPTLVSGWSIRRYGREVGKDALGNLYFAEKKGKRRWVVYNGPNDASRIPPDWYSWLHHQIDGLPDESLPPAPKFLKDPVPNLTGTPLAYRPPGALERGGQRAAASGDYEAWTPGEG
jgi:NADH:ubiquinone oxidoreductase subunit